MLQLKGQYSLDDFKKAQALHARQAAAAAGTRIFLILVALIFYIALIALVLLGRLQWPYLLAPLALLLVFLLYQYGYRPYILTRTFRKNKDLSAPFEMELSNEGLSVRNPQGSALIPWNNFVKWVEGQEMILLYRSYIMFQMVPKRLFGSESQLQTLRAYLTLNKIPQAGKMTKRISSTRLLVYIVLLVAIVIMLVINIKSAPR